MPDGFSNPIIGGGGALVYPSIHSPNYAAGLAGWTINKDGSAEFNNATVRGTITAATIIAALIESASSGRRSTFDANGDIKVYNASGAVLSWFDNADNAQFFYADTGSAAQGALTASIAASSGTDPFGNAYLAGESSYANLGGGFFQAITMNGGFMATGSATSAAGPWTVLGEIGAVRSDGDTHFAAVGGSHLVADTRLYALNPVTGNGRADWQDMRPLANSFIGTIAGQYPPQYRLSAGGFVDVAGYVQTPAASANYNSITFATLPAAYRPAANAGHRWPITMTTNVAPVGTPLVQIDTSGNLQFHSMPALMSSQVIGIYGRYPLNAPIAV
jgi:hypothetical protein